jgi:hypothetical protein
MVSVMSRSFAGALSLLLMFVVGCGANIIPGTLQTSPNDYSTLTGDWVFQITPTSGAAPFVSMAGYIDQGSPANTSSNTAAFQLQSPGDCYQAATLIPWYGDVTSNNFDLYSFDVNAQFVTITGTKNSSGTVLNGTYSIAGGCANGATGTITATRYAPIHGTYGGPIGQSSRTAKLTLGESATGTGSGNFLLTGSADFSGISCFTSGTLSGTAGSILGNTVNLDFTTNEAPASQVVLAGTIDPQASALTVTSLQVTGGNCSGSLGAATLQKQ